MFYEMHQMTRKLSFLERIQRHENDLLLTIVEHPERLKTAKASLLALISANVKTLLNHSQVGYRDFIPLYHFVVDSKLLKIQSHPHWDAFWRKRKPESQQKAMAVIRNAASEVLIEKADNLGPRAAGDLIERALEEKLFTEHRSNWGIFDTKTLTYLNDRRLEFYSQDRHQRGIYTPPPPLNQLNGWQGAFHPLY